MRVFANISKVALPKRRIWVNIIRICQRAINIINCAQEGVFSITGQGAVKEKIRICFDIKTTRTNGFRVTWKLCLNLCSRKWLKPRCSFVKYLISLYLWQLKTLFRDGLINFNKFFLKTLRLAAPRRLGSSLFHSMTVDRKKVLKKLGLVRNRIILSVFLVLYYEFFVGIKLKR